MNDEAEFAVMGELKSDGQIITIQRGFPSKEAAEDLRMKGEQRRPYRNIWIAHVAGDLPQRKPGRGRRHEAA